MHLDQLPTIGTPFEGGHYGGTIRIGAVLFAIAWAPKADGETKGPWHPNRAKVPGAQSCNDSLANTLAMAEAGCPLATWALDLRINGHDDWCLPARDVIELAYRHLKPTTDETCCTFRDGDNPSSMPAGYPYREDAPIVQTSVAAFQGQGPEAFARAWYWSSSQCSESYAWLQYFGLGTQYVIGKKFEGHARAVRLIQLDA